MDFSFTTIDTKLIEGCALDKPQKYKNLIMYPIVCHDIDNDFECLTFDEALSTDCIEVAEKSIDDELFVGIKNVGEQPILLFFGDVIQPGKIIDRSLIIASQIEIDAPMGIFGETTLDYTQNCDDFFSHLHPVVDQIGSLVLINDTIAGMDLFGNYKIFQKFFTTSLVYYINNALAMEGDESFVLTEKALHCFISSFTNRCISTHCYAIGGGAIQPTENPVAEGISLIFGKYPIHREGFPCSQRRLLAETRHQESCTGVEEQAAHENALMKLRLRKFDNGDSRCDVIYDKNLNRNANSSHAHVMAALNDMYDSLEEMFGDSAFTGKTLAEFEHYLVNRKSEPEPVYGMFTTDASVVKFYDDKHGENILADIRSKNEEKGMGNIRIPNTDIEMINYSYCPVCNEIHTYDDLIQYYIHPINVANVDRSTQVRKDTRVSCKSCGAFFLPSLIISDGTPRHETQFLCRTQVVNSVEEYYLESNRRVLTKRNNNVVLCNGKKRLKNDVKIEEISVKPTLISNFIQYMPPDLMIPFIEGKNIERGDFLF